MKKLIKIHRIIGLLTFIPLILICLSGIMLHLRNELSWLSPPKPPKLAKSTLDQMISPQEINLKLSIHKKLKSITYNLEDNFISVRTDDNYEYNLHPISGIIITEGKKRSLVIGQIHQSLYLGKFGKYFIVSISSLALVFLLLSGVIIAIKRKKYVK